MVLASALVPTLVVFHTVFVLPRMYDRLDPYVVPNILLHVAPLVLNAVVRSSTLMG
jgi:hypothetical protein